MEHVKIVRHWFLIAYGVGLIILYVRVVLITKVLLIQLTVRIVQI